MVLFENGDGAEGQGGADDQANPDDGQQPQDQQLDQQQNQEQQTQEQQPEAPAPMTDEELQEWLAPDMAQAQGIEAALVQDIKDLVPGSRPYSPENKHAIQASWDDLMKEYNGISTFIEHFQKLRGFVIGPNFDPSNPRWRATGIGRIYQSFDVILRDPKLKLKNKTIKSINQKRAQEVDASKREIARDIQNIVIAYQKLQEQTLNAIEKQMRSDFIARIDWLDNQWATNPPSHMNASHVAGHRMNLRKARTKISRDLPHFFENPEDHQKRLREYREINETIDNQEHLFDTNHQDAKALEQAAALGVSQKFLYKKLDDVTADAHKAIDPIAADFARTVDARIADMQGLMRLVENTELYDDDERKSILEGYQKTVDNLAKNRDIKKTIFLTLDDDTILTDKETGKELYVEFKDENGNPTGRVPMRKGIRQQIDFLGDPRLKEEERAQYAAGLNEALDKMVQDIEESKSYYKNDLQVLKDKVEQQTEALNSPTPANKNFDMMWMSAYDAVRAFEIISEWSKRRYQRAATQRVGKFGSKLLDPLNNAPWPLGPLRTLPNEFDKEVERSEQEEVDQYKNVYANKDMWQVEDVAWQTKNQDEFKACLLLLAENGRLRWDNDKILDRLMYFQDKVTFSKAEVEVRDISRFYDKLKKACGHIWDFDTFNGFKNQNSSAYDSKKSEYEQNCHEWAEAEGTISSVIAGLLKAHKERGRAAKVDPILYEQIITYSIKYGKMGAEEKMYYLIQGIATGILAPDRGSVINSNDINAYPAIDWFGSPTARGSKPTIEDVQEVAQYDKVAFDDWFHRVAMTSDRVTQRVDKTLTQGNRLDHDDLTALLAYMGETTTETMLQTNNDGFRLPLTGVQNGTVSMMFYMDHMAENYNKMSNWKEAFSRFVGTFSRYDAILMNRMYNNNRGYFRWDPATYNADPRANKGYDALYGRGSMSCRDNMEKVRKYLSYLDPVFFGAVYDYSSSKMTNERAKEIVKEITDRYGTDKMFDGSVPNSVDELYRSTGGVTRWLINNNPNSFQNMIANIRADQKRNESRVREAADDGKTVAERYAVAQKDIQKLRIDRKNGATVKPARGMKWGIPGGGALANEEAAA